MTDVGMLVRAAALMVVGTAFTTTTTTTSLPRALPPRHRLDLRRKSSSTDNIIIQASPATTSDEMVHPVVVVAAPPILANVSLEVAAARKEESLIDRYPLLAKSASMGVTYGLADVAAQLFSWLAAGEVIPLAQRLRRSVSLMFVGCFAVGPLLAIWFDLLEFLVPGRKPRAIATRTALDQIVQVPIMICIIFSLSALAEGHTLAFCLHKCQEKLVPTWRDCVGIWTPAQLINQGFVPLKYRVLFQAVISFFWDTYLSIVAHSVTPPLVVVAS